MGRTIRVERGHHKSNEIGNGLTKAKVAGGGSTGAQSGQMKLEKTTQVRGGRQSFGEGQQRPQKKVQPRQKRPEEAPDGPQLGQTKLKERRIKEDNNKVKVGKKGDQRRFSKGRCARRRACEGLRCSVCF